MSRTSQKQSLGHRGDERRRGKVARRPGRRERRQTETRERLMRCALRLFAERGFAGTSIEDITEAADVGKGTFFNYFPTKEHVLDAFGKSRIAKVEVGLAEARAGKKEVLHLLRQLAHKAADEEQITPKLMRSFLVAALLNDSVRRSMIVNQSHGRSLSTEIVAIGQKRGEIRRDVPARLIARGFQQGIFGGFLMWALDPTLELTTWLDTCIDLVLFGIASPGRERETLRAAKTNRKP